LQKPCLCIFWSYHQEGVKAQQVIFNIPADLGTRELSQSDILKRFSKAIINSGSITLDHRLRLVERLVNKGMLGEFLKDKVVTWFAQQVKLDSFTALLAPWVGILQSKNKAT